LAVAVNKRTGSLLDPASAIDESNLFTPVRHWKKSSLEELFRVVALVSLLIAGLSRPGQNILWVSDEDAILANEARMREVPQLVGGMMSNLLDHTLGHLRYTTTHYDSGQGHLEDLVAIPDLVAGALLSYLQCDGALNGGPVSLDERANPIMWWLTNITSISSRIMIVDKSKTDQHCSVKTLTLTPG